MKSINCQKKRVSSLSGMIGIVLLAGLTGCSTFAPPLKSPNASQGSAMQKWDVEKYLERKGPNPVTPVIKEKPSRPTQYEAFLNNAREQYYVKKSQLRDYVSKLSAEWKNVTSTLTGD